MQECNCCETDESNATDRTATTGDDADGAADGAPYGGIVHAHDDGTLGAATRARLAAVPADPLERELPPRVAEPVAALVGREVDTLGEYLDALREVGSEWMPPGLDDLCHDPEGPHRAVVGGSGAARADATDPGQAAADHAGDATEDTVNATESAASGDASREFRLVCVLDAFGLPALLGEPVTVTSAVPGGGRMTLAISGESVTATRAGSDEPLDDPVLSFGVAADPDVDGPVEPADVYRSGCPYVHAFPTPERYERWAARTDGETIPLALSAGVPLATAILAGY